MGENQMNENGMNEYEAYEDRTIAQKKENRRFFSKIGLFYFAGGVVSRLLAQLAFALLTAWKPEWADNTNVSIIISAIMVYFIGMPLIVWLTKRLPASAPEQHAMKFHQWLGALVSGMAIAYISNVVGLLLAAIIGLAKGSAVNNPALNTINSMNLGLSFVVMVLIAPAFEEMVFRKVLIDRVRKYGEGVAVLLSGLMFGLFHGNLNQFAYAFTLGLVLAFIYVKTGKVRYTIFIHMTINSIGGLIAPLALKLIDYEEYMRRYLIAIEYGDMQGLIEFMTEHMAGLVLMTLLAIVMLGAILSGIIVLIVNAKKICFNRGEITIAKGERFRTIILNVGMILFCIFWCGMIVVQLFI